MLHEASLLELLQESRCSFCCLVSENIIQVGSVEVVCQVYRRS